LHQPKYRSSIIEDFNKLPQFIAEAAGFREEKGPGPDNVEQLSLF
jgi:hypothetical protein